jgi:hypothetical protein
MAKGKLVPCWLQVHEVTLNGSTYAVKVMPLFDINTARPYHFRDM